ncbi:phosphate signaling complex protein PhoU [Mycoplasma capricolum subsp. capripneumoniae]|uniref:PhoU family transcriptional regulator n=1 Tax=Mycoplasma capricolum subsp. capripneumoniae 87001 TaxID=1124992 RepID=A0A9N7BEU9_MYCCC|nr:phosphate signaling complex protein PhoU [Mycoplasma capricolum]AJK51521.1 PhoU family transcriptional regulator [Mycoplasma capricolum subsp. capripneumoniae 87001]AOQ22182.1 phosphate transport system regulatory protein PhoU [Mycoplasma capricolum subsp. capripneumoniae M1601]AQU77548.1 phosphate transport system regulatory protein PhoU [Mycoplasma capricolum subsp. capripneumoniae]KEY84538.1 Phosphate transport system regulator PhoU [Mycoplasma capricolum subsp. capripneumoniae 99108]QDL
MSSNKILDRDLDQLRELIEEMIKETKLQYAQSCLVIKEKNRLSEAQKVIEHDKLINDMQNKFTSMALWKISKQKLVAKDLRLAIGGILITREIERIADYSKAISKFFIFYKPNEKHLLMISELYQLVVEMLDIFSDVFGNLEIDKEQQVLSLEEKINEKFRSFYDLLIDDIRQKTTKAEAEEIAAVLKQLFNLERAGDHLLNVQQIINFVKTSKFIEKTEKIK